ncbi:TonB-dependent receptor plug domain-containing protein [Pseudidiomarina aquimaris]|nr:TonB-dependent receptor [Pseudidiomarina aquimaris]
MKKNKLANAVLFALMSSSLTLSASAVAQQQQDEDEQEEQEEEQVERLKVTGSRLSQTDMENASPVVIISDEDIKNRGFTTAFDALKNLAQNTGQIQGDEFGSQGGFTPNAQTISLRGLAPGQALILLNGRRLAENPTPYNGQSNFVSLSSIPTAAIERIEVLTNGASAIYGSDAVAGVVNIILKDDVDSTTVSVMGGTTKDGGGDEVRLQVASGITTSDMSWTYGLEYHDIDPIFASDRDWLDSNFDSPTGGSYSYGIVVQDAYSGLNVDPGDGCERSGSGYERRMRTSTASGRELGYYCATDTAGDYSIQNGREKLSGFVSGSMDISNNTEFFLDALVTTQEAQNRGFRHFIFEPVIEPTPDGSGNLGWGNYLLKQRMFSFEELGPKSSSFDEKNINVTAGMRGMLSNFYEWEVSYSHSVADFESRRAWLKNEVVMDYFFGSDEAFYPGFLDGNGQYDFYAPITDEMRNELLGEQVINGDSYSRTLFGSISGDLFEMPAGMAQFAAVVEYNKQGYDLMQDERTLSDTEVSWWGLTGTEGGGDRDRWALGMEFGIPLLETLDLSLAARYDKYDDDTTDVGGRLSPMVGLEYRPIDSLLLRATYGKSFRAPDMHYVFAGDSGFYTTVYDWTACREGFVADGGNPDDFIPSGANCQQYTANIEGTRAGSTTLEEEKGTNIGVGIVYDLTDNLSFTLDWYEIELEDIVTDESVSGLIGDEYDCNYGLDGRDPDSAFCQNVYSKIERAGGDDVNAGDLTGVNVSPTNASRQLISGYDATVRYNYPTEFGDFTFRAEYTNTQSYKYQATPEDEYTDYRNLASFYDPRTSLTGVVGYQYQDFAVYLTGRRVGSTPWDTQPAEHSNPDSDQFGDVSRTSPYVYFNLTAQYRLTDNSSITFTGNNITDRRPPEDDTWTSWPYYNIFAYGGASRGASYYLEYVHRF